MSAHLPWLLLAAGATDHVPPDPPQTHVHENMPYAEMAEMMGMDDRARFTKIMLDEFEWRDASDSTLAWDASAWYGGDYHKVWIETEGEHAGDQTHSRTELLWDRVATRWWNTRVGLRHDSADGASQDWLSVGVAGLAPGFIEVEAAAYFGEGGRTALRFTADYDLLLTQKLVLHPEVELHAESGATEFAFGLRLRYEIVREFAPYAGIVWTHRSAEDESEASFVAGLRLWF